MSSSSVPQIQFTPTGLVLPAEGDILAGVQADTNAAFGGNLNPALETPQGQLSSSTTAIIGDVNAVFAEFVNQVDPDYATGFMQDAIGRIYFLNRDPAEPTAVQCDCEGLAGTPITLGALAEATDGNLYVCVGAGTIPVSGTISLPFACLVNGPIACPANSLNAIYQAIPGWDRVNNPGDGDPGQLVESASAFEFRRKNSVAANAHGTNDAVYAAVFGVAGVLDAYVTDNPTSATVNTGSTNYPIIKNSIYVAAIGGASADVAQAIWTKKDTGCNMNGNTSVTVVDSIGYAFPQPSYVIKFEIPPALPILFAVQIANNAALPANIVALTKAAIVAAFAGADGGQRARIGAAIFASRYYSPVIAIAPGIVSILSILIGTSSATLNSLVVGIDQYPTIDPANISVTLV